MQAEPRGRILVVFTPVGSRGCSEHLPVCWGQVVYQWARGVPFKEICALTDVMEGSIGALLLLSHGCLIFSAGVECCWVCFHAKLLVLCIVYP